MKITVAFYGIPRCSRISAPSIEANLLQPLRSVGQVSVVQHLWQIQTVKSARSGEDIALAEDAYIHFRNFEGVIEPPAAFEESELFATWKSFGDSFNDNFSSLRNLMHQLQSLKRVTELIRRTEPDVVVFARPDLQYHDEIPVSACRFVRRFPGTCVVPIWNWWAGFNDRFAVCGRGAYEAYGTRVDRAVDFAQSTGRPIHSESLVKYALGKARVRTLAIPTTASRVRADGTVRPENFNSVETCVLWRGRSRDRLDRLQCRLTREMSKIIFSDAPWHKV